MNLRSILPLLSVSTIAQVAMVVVGHAWDPLRPWYGPLGMSIALGTGFLYRRSAPDRWSKIVSGAAAIGGLAALAGIGISFLLGDVPATLLVLGSLASAVAGAIGGAVGGLGKRPVNRENA